MSRLTTAMATRSRARVGGGVPGHRSRWDAWSRRVYWSPWRVRSRPRDRHVVAGHAGGRDGGGHVERAGVRTTRRGAVRRCGPDRARRREAGGEGGAGPSELDLEGPRAAGCRDVADDHACDVARRGRVVGEGDRRPRHALRQACRARAEPARPDGEAGCGRVAPGHEAQGAGQHRGPPQQVPPGAARRPTLLRGSPLRSGHVLHVEAPRDGAGARTGPGRSRTRSCTAPGRGREVPARGGSAEADQLVADQLVADQPVPTTEATILMTVLASIAGLKLLNVAVAFTVVVPPAYFSPAGTSVW